MINDFRNELQIKEALIKEKDHALNEYHQQLTQQSNKGSQGEFDITALENEQRQFVIATSSEGMAVQMAESQTEGTNLRALGSDVPG